METRAKEVILKGTKVTLQVWDTAGVERFATLTKSFFRSADGVMLAFDVSSRLSFESNTRQEPASGCSKSWKTLTKTPKKCLLPPKPTWTGP